MKVVKSFEEYDTPFLVVEIGKNVIYVSVIHPGPFIFRNFLVIKADENVR